MKREDAFDYWKSKYESAKDYSDEHWEADERRAHREYVEALECAVEALEGDRYYQILHELLVSGNGYMAIIDLTRSLSVGSDEKDAIISELQAEKRLVKKLSESSQKAQDKVRAINSLLDMDIPPTDSNG